MKKSSPIYIFREVQTNIFGPFILFFGLVLMAFWLHFWSTLFPIKQLPYFLLCCNFFPQPCWPNFFVKNSLTKNLKNCSSATQPRTRTKYGRLEQEKSNFLKGKILYYFESSQNFFYLWRYLLKPANKSYGRIILT